MSDIRLQEAMIELGTHRGKAKKPISDTHRRKVRERVSKELLAEYERRVR